MSNRRVSRTLKAAVVLLLMIGIVMLASTSSVRGATNYSDPYFFLKRQVVWLLISLMVFLALSRFDYHWWRRKAVLLPMAVGSVILLALVFVPGVGLKVGGSHRWLGLGPFSVQPSEFVKLTTVLVLASWTAYAGRRMTRFLDGVLYPAMGLGVVLGLTISEPDFGTTLLIATVAALMLFVSGVRLVYLGSFALLGLAGFVAAVIRDPVRMRRVMAFLNPEDYPVAAHHLIQSKVALMRGEFFGVGLWNSMQKQLYLPEAHTDFILAIIGEELGLVGTLGVVLLFLVILICGIKISARAPDAFGKAVGFGITMMTAVQAAINVGVVTGCLPTKGLPLPFISYGGSSLLASMAGMAILVNVGKHAAEDGDEHTRPIKDRAHSL
jgi:cell division protein FtsW